MALVAVEQLVEALQGTVSGDTQRISQSEAYLKQVQYQNGYMSALMQVVTSPQIDPTIKQSSSIVLKNHVKKEWSKEGENDKLSAQDRDYVRQHIVDAIQATQNQVQSQLAEIFRQLVMLEYPEKCPFVSQQILTNLLASKDLDYMFGSLLSLRILLRAYEYSSKEKSFIPQITNTALPRVLQILQECQNSKDQSIYVVKFVKLIFKIFWSSTFTYIPEILVQQEQFAGWMSALHFYMVVPVPKEGQPEDYEERQRWVWWKMKKRVNHISYKLFQTYSHSKKLKSESQIKFSQLYREHCMLQFLNDHLQILHTYSQGEFQSQRVLNLNISFITKALLLKSTYAIIQPHLDEIIFKIIFPLTQFDEEDERLWEEDSKEYVRKTQDIMEEIYNVKTEAMNFVFELCKLQMSGKNITQQYFIKMMMHCYDSMNSFLTHQSTASTQDAKATYAALSVILALEPLIKKRPEANSRMQLVLVQQVLPIAQCRFGFLRSLACKLVAAYAKFEFTTGKGHGEVFNQLITQIVRSLSDSELPVRVEAALALRQFVDAMTDIPTLKQLVKPILQQLFDIIHEVDNDDLVFTLESLVEKIDHDIVPYSMEVCDRLIGGFQKSMKQEQEASEDEDGVIAAFASLRTIDTLIIAVRNRKDLLNEMESKLFPILYQYTSEEGALLVEEVCTITTTLLYYQKSVSPLMWSLWPRFHAMATEWAQNNMDDLIGVLDNYISMDVDTFVSSTSPSYLVSACQMAEYMIQREDVQVSDQFMGTQLVGIMLENCKGRIDQVVPQLISVLVNKFAELKDDVFRDSLVTALSDCLYYNNNLTVKTLIQLNQLENVFISWIKMVYVNNEKVQSGVVSRRYFKSIRQKKINSLGLSSVLQVPDAILSETVKNSFGEVLKANLFLLIDLKVLLKEKEEDEAEDEEDDDYDDYITDRKTKGKKMIDDEQFQDNQPDKPQDYNEQVNHIEDIDDEYDEDASDWLDELALDDEDEYDSPIDQVDPYLYFAETLSYLQNNQPQRFKQILAQAQDKAQEQLQQMMKYAEQLKINYQNQQNKVQA